MQPEIGHGFFELITPNPESHDRPWYENLSHEIKDKLASSLKDFSGADKLSSLNSISDLFDQVNIDASCIWEEATSSILVDAFSKYKSNSHAGQAFLDTLSDPHLLLKSLGNNRNWQYESLRQKGDSEIWYGLVLALSEREQLKVKLLQQYLDKTTPDDENRWGISKLELQIYAGMMLDLQPHVDQIYIKQMRIVDSGMSWSKNPPEYGSVTGSSAFYIIREGDKDNIYTFHDVFPDEIGNIQSVFKRYSTMIVQGLEDQTLSPAYQDLPHYLNRLANSLSLGKEQFSIEGKVVDPSAIFQRAYEEGNEDESLCIGLAIKGCPIVINPPGFVNQADDRLDMEFMIGLLLGDKSNWYQKGQQLSQITLDLLNRRNLPLENLAPILHQKFLAVNGSNLAYTSLASAGGFISFDDGRHLEVGRDRHNRYSHLVKNSMTQASFIQAIAISTMTHELGHLVMFLDMGLNQKMGSSIHINKLEELKADTVGSIIFQELLSKGQAELTSKEFIEQFLLNYIDDILDSPVDPSIDKSPAWYAFSAKTMILMLLESGAITYAAGQFEILDGDLGVVVLSNLGNQILDLYLDEFIGPEEVELFVLGLENRMTQNSQLQTFLQQLDQLSF